MQFQFFNNYALQLFKLHSTKCFQPRKRRVLLKTNTKIVGIDFFLILKLRPLISRYTRSLCLWTRPVNLVPSIGDNWTSWARHFITHFKIIFSRRPLTDCPGWKTIDNLTVIRGFTSESPAWSSVEIIDREDWPSFSENSTVSGDENGLCQHINDDPFDRGSRPYAKIRYRSVSRSFCGNKRCSPFSFFVLICVF